MDQARMDQAKSRIEAALARIERAAGNSAAAPEVGSMEGWDAYRDLKKRLRGTLSELDAVIAELER